MPKLEAIIDEARRHDESVIIITAALMSQFDDQAASVAQAQPTHGCAGGRDVWADVVKRLGS